jgi:hypothetical protein
MDLEDTLTLYPGVRLENGEMGRSLFVNEDFKVGIIVLFGSIHTA